MVVGCRLAEVTMGDATGIPEVVADDSNPCADVMCAELLQDCFRTRNRAARRAQRRSVCGDAVPTGELSKIERLSPITTMN